MIYKKSIKEVVCFFLAFIIAFFIVETCIVVPNDSMTQSCELTLIEYLAEPKTFVLKDNFKLTIKNTAITASTYYSFVYATATLNTNGVYEIKSHIRYIPFVFTQIIVLALLSLLIFTFLTNFLIIFCFICKKIYMYLLAFFKFAYKMFQKIMNYFRKKRLRKSLKEYENPEYQRIYQIGYNHGYANGFSDGTNNAHPLRTDIN